MQMGTNFSFIEENYKRILYNVDETVAKYRKSDEKVDIIAVTKTVAPDAVNFAISCGINKIGENRVQEYLSKKDYYDKKADVHFIGHLQSNKVKYIINDINLIQSVDSIKIAQQINNFAEKTGKIQDILIEVNVGGEETKYGISPNMLKDTVLEISTLNNVKIKGLMTILPINASEEIFYKMQKLYIDILEENIDNIDMKILSMGMSNDYQTAIKYGSNMIRVGSALFGERVYWQSIYNRAFVICQI